MTGPAAIAEALRARQSFILTSHARPDGDAVGSSVALGLALEELGKQVTVVLADPVPEAYRALPGVDRIRITRQVTERADAVVLLECSDLERPGISGFADAFVVNIDHHLGNKMYGAVNWFDDSVAACGQMVADVIDALGVRWTPAIASQLYLAISTDTGSFRYGPISAHTFEVCRRIADTGVQPAELSRQFFDSFSIGRVKLTGAMLSRMELHHGNRLALLAFDDDLLRECGATIDDTEGLVNMPLAAREVSAAALLKRQDASTFRLSLRSKGEVDVRSVADTWQGGGHRNAAGCTVVGQFAEVRDAVIRELTKAIDAAPVS